MNNSSKLYKDLILNARKEKNIITREATKELMKIYKNMSKDVIKRLETNKGGFTQAYLKDYSKYLNYRLDILSNDVNNLIGSSIEDISLLAATIEGDFVNYLNGKYFLDVPKDILNQFYSIPQDVLLDSLSGKMYKDNKSLSERIWGYKNKNYKDMQFIINEGIVGNKSYTEIIKDLSIYVNPTSKRPYDFSKIYPKINKNVCYNSLRLLRTQMNHIFQESMLRKIKNNPYIQLVRWNLSEEHEYRQVKRFGEDECDDYANSDTTGRGKGLFYKKDVPVAHPNCLCYQTYELEKSLEDIGKELNNMSDNQLKQLFQEWNS